MPLKTDKGNMVTLGKDELARQVAQYATLPLTKTARGQAAVVIWGISAISLVGYLIGAVWIDALVIALVFSVLAFSMRKGSRGAIIALMVLFPAISILNLSMQASTEVPIFGIFLIVVVVILLWRALQVERARTAGKG